MATASRTERLDFRLPARQKRLIERAAALTGQTVSDFVLGTVRRRSRKVIRKAETIALSNRARAQLMAALDNAEAKPNAALVRAAKRYNAAMAGARTMDEERARAEWDSWIAGQHYQRSVPDREMLEALANFPVQARRGDLEALNLPTGLTIGEAASKLLTRHYP